ncbi:MAG: hypothetical protein WCA81_10820 [Rhizomicrobium sp.]
MWGHNSGGVSRILSVAVVIGFGIASTFGVTVTAFAQQQNAGENSNASTEQGVPTDVYEGTDKLGNSVSIVVVKTPSGKGIQSLGYTFVNCVSVKSVSASGNARFGQIKGDTISFPFTILAGMSIADFTNPSASVSMKEYSATLSLTEKRSHLTLTGLRLLSSENPAHNLSGINFSGPALNGECKLQKRYEFDLAKRQ